MSRTVIEDDLDIYTLRPIQDYVLIEILDRTMTSGGIHLVRTSATPNIIGKVLALGSGILDHKTGHVYPFELRVGDIVLAMDYAGERMELRGGKYRLVRSHGIWAKLKLVNAQTYEIAELEPRSEFLLVEPDDETMTRSKLLYFPRGQNAESAGRLATVIRVGPGRWRSGTDERESIPVTQGEKVLITRFAGTDVEVGGKWLRLIQESDVHCVAEE